MTKIVRERDLITDLFKQWKNSPCLWDPTHKFYFNKEAKNQQYEMMLETYKKLDAQGTVASLKKKLEHYRTSYRRERRKVENSAVEGASPDSIHKPNLWYYNLLTFFNTKQGCASEDEDEKNIQTKKRRVSPTDNSNNEEKEEERQEENYADKWNSPDYIAAYGESIAKQLKELDESVRYEAERLISDVIYRARVGTLTKYSPEVVDTLLIPKFGPSWYDVADQVVQEPSKCLVTLADEVKQRE